MIAALALLATACQKEEGADGRIRIFAENMSSASGGSKMLMDPAHIDDAVWVENERVNLNSNTYAIVSDGNGGFCLNTGNDVLSGDVLYAIYPATVEKVNGDHIVVSNNNAGAGSVAIHSLTVNFASGGQKVYFPLAATANRDASSMTFKHLTGGLKITLQNDRISTLNVARLVVTITNASDEPAIYKDLKTEWSDGMLPSLPEGEVGGISGDQGAVFVPSMTLYLKDEVGGTAYKQIAANGQIVFCMPMLAKSVKHLQIIGYDDNDVELFNKSKNLDNAFDVERNVMYTIPTININ